MTDDEAQSTGEFQMRHSHATHDLFNAIADGDFPEYDFYIQTLDPADELSLDFDPLDCTKVGCIEEAPDALHLSALKPSKELSLHFDALVCTKMGCLPPFPAPFCMVIKGMGECSRSLALQGSVSSELLHVASHAALSKTGSMQSRCQHGHKRYSCTGKLGRKGDEQHLLCRCGLRKIFHSSRWA